MSSERVGTTLASYRIESVIGRGGMGVVYLAEHLRLKRKVAIKILAPEVASDDRFRDRFIHESELAASLDHPNIVDIYDAGEAEGLLYLAMRYVGGSDLKTMIGREGTLEPERAVSLLAQVAGALDAAHERGLVHRDIKSANILVEPPMGSLGEHAYLTDFGLTKRPESMSGLTKTGQFLGTVEYAAPEQFEGRPLGPWTDVYSLGCVLYEALTGEVPYPRDLEAAVMHAHLKEPPPRPTSKRPDLPRGFDRVVATAMAKDPAGRYPSCGALADAASLALTGEVGPGLAGGRRRRRPLIWAAAAVAMALVAGGIFALTRPKSASHNPAAATAVPLGVVRIDPSTNRVTDVIGISTATDFAVGGGYLWVDSSKFIDKINESTALKVGEVPLQHGLLGLAIGPGAKDIAYGNGRVWDLGVRSRTRANITTPNALFEVDPTTNGILRQLPVPRPSSLAFADGILWVASAGDAKVFKVDSRSGRVLTTIAAESTQNSANALAAGAEGVWVVQTVPGTATHIDPETGAVEAMVSIPHADGVAVGHGYVWVTNATDGIVTQVNPGTDAVIKTYTVARPSTHKCSVPGGIAATNTAVWVLSSEDGTLVRVDPSAQRVVAHIPIGACPYAVAVDEAGVWVSRTERIDIA